MHFDPKTYFVYIMSNRSQTLYTGVTNSCFAASGSTKRQPDLSSLRDTDRLAYLERYEDVRRAIGREKQIKGLLRIKKIALVVGTNPTWSDLSEGWYDRHQFQPDNA